MTPLLVCFAVPAEAEPFRQRAAGRPDVTVLLTGIGARNAERCARAAITRWRPVVVLTCGFAGGLNPAHTVGTVLFAADATQPLAAALRRAGAQPARFHPVDRIVVSAAEKTRLLYATGADAVDMESTAIRRVCEDLHIASATVRVISDAASDDLPLDFNCFLNARQELDYLRLVGGVLCRPWRVGRLLQFARQCRRAAECLARTLVEIMAEG